MKKIINFIFRLIAFPFVFAILLVGKVRDLIYACAYFLWYGGEWISHMEEDRVWMADIYTELKAQRETEKTNDL
jgi:hypothetical protein